MLNDVSAHKMALFGSRSLSMPCRNFSVHPISRKYTNKIPNTKTTAPPQHTNTSHTIRLTHSMETEPENRNGTSFCHSCLKQFQRDKLLRCSACKSVYYCSKICQKKDWKVHKRSCKRIRTAITRTSTAGTCTNAQGQERDEYQQQQDRDDFHHIRPPQAQAQEQAQHTLAAKASLELQNLLSGMTIREATENFHRASDELERMSRSKTTETETATENDVHVEAINERRDEGTSESESEGKSTCTTLTGAKETETVIKARKGDTNDDDYDNDVDDREVKIELERLQMKEKENENFIDPDLFAVEKDIHQNKNENKLDGNENKNTSMSNRAIEKGFGTAFAKAIDKEWNGKKHGPENSGREEEDEFKSDSDLDKGTWNCAVEKLVHISTFAFTLTPPLSSPLLKAKDAHEKNIDLDLDLRRDSINIQVNKVLAKRKQQQTLIRITRASANTENMNTNSDKIHGEEILATVLLPRGIVSTKDDILQSMLLMDKGCFITFRVRYDYDYGDADIYLSGKPLTPSEAIDNLQCRSCDQYLLRTTRPGPAGTSATPTPPSSSAFDPSISNTNSNGDKNKTDEGPNLNPPIIKNVFHLPSGHWDEITDYLTCYEGQPNIDFSSVSNVAQKASAFEDEAILVLNKNDLHNVCILAIDGYGEQVSDEIDDIHGNGSGTGGGQRNEDNGDKKEENDNGDADPEPLVMGGGEDATYRGRRNWRDAVGGATLCCNVCCSVLGYASIVDPDTCRLLKHRLRAPARTRSLTSNGGSPSSRIHRMQLHHDHFSGNTCGSFIGKELIRFAEAQAVFTFAVFGYNYAGDNHGNAYAQGCILLKVLSWNTTLAVKRKSGSALEFRRIVKVIYAETDPTSLLDASSNNSQGGDPMTFRWGGADLCCPPNGQARKSNQNSIVHPPVRKNGGGTEEELETATSILTQASVNMYLSSEELTELRRDLVSGKEFFSNELSKATVMGLRLHRSEDVKTENTSLSYLSL